MPGLFQKTPPEKATQEYRDLCRPDEAGPRASKYNRRARKMCEYMWSLFQPYADDHFLTEFPLQTHQRWFEMYLTASMIEAQLNVRPHSRGPDILVELDNQRIWIEATCATSGDPMRPDSVPPKVPDRVSEEPVDQYVLRIRSSLAAKEEKYKKYIMDGIVSQNDIAIIAINVFRIDGPGPYTDSHMKRALYGLGDPVVSISRSTREIVDIGHQSEYVVQKSGGAEVNVRPFCDGSMSHISSVLKSLADIWNLPDRLGSDFVLYPNLVCGNRWKPGTLDIGHEWVFQERPEDWTGHLSRIMSRKGG